MARSALAVDFLVGYGGRFAAAFVDGLFPLFAFRDEIARRGITIQYIIADRLASQRRGTVLCLSSRAFRYPGGSLATDHLDQLDTWRRQYPHIVWFDSRDSAGTTQFEVLEFVDRYCKKQLFRDRRLYQQALYQNRNFTDYVHREYGITDVECEPRDVALPDAFQRKLTVAWNLAYCDYRSLSHTTRWINIVKGTLDPPFSFAVRRTIDVHARFKTDFLYDTIAFQRRRLADGLRRLHQLDCRVGYVPRAVYRREMRRAKAVLSPFGWGEICLRDFEAMICGCALMKPSIAQVETWPDVFLQGNTYIDLPWRPEEALISLELAIRDEERLMTVAHAAHRVYRALWTKAGREAFVDRLEALLTPAPAVEFTPATGGSSATPT